MDDIGFVVLRRLVKLQFRSRNVLGNPRYTGFEDVVLKDYSPTTLPLDETTTPRARDGNT